MDGELKDRYLFRTAGPGCHWCGTAPPKSVWGPFGTKLCAYCHDLAEVGDAWLIVETVAARIEVRGRWMHVDPEGWRKREHRLVEQFLAIRTTCSSVHRRRGDVPYCE